MSTLTSTTPSISDLYADCIQALGRFVEALGKENCRVLCLGQVHITEILDEYGRIKIWGDQTKADLPTKARGSLDDTLRHNDDLKKLVQGILMRMRAILGQAIPIATRKHDPTAGAYQDSISSVSADSDSNSDWSSDSGSNDDSTHDSKDKSNRRTMPKICLLVQQIEDQIRSLYDLSSLLRRPRITDKYIRSVRSKLKASTSTTSDILPLNVAFTIADERHIAEKMLQWRGLTKSGRDITVENEQSAVPAEESTNNLIEDAPWLCQRLAQANTKRREQLQYWKDHPYEAKQYSTSLNSHMEHLLRRGLFKGDKDTHGSQSEISTAKHHGSHPSREGTISTLTKQTEASKQSFSTAAFSDVYETKTHTRPRTIYAPTAAGQRRSDSIPDPPKPEEGVAIFSCPYCRMTLESAEMENRQSWKRHVFHDLRPYVCTFEDCNNAGKLYVSRHEWTYHELQVHRRRYVCQEPDCGNVYTSRGDISMHLQKHHAGSISSAQLSIIVDLCDRQVDTSEAKEETCIFCGDTLILSRLQGHLAFHMEDLVLFVLPRYYEDESGNSNASIEAAKIESEDGGNIRSEASNLGYSRPPGRKQDPTEFDGLAATEETGYDSKFSHWSIQEEEKSPASKPPMNKTSMQSSQVGHDGEAGSSRKKEESESSSHHVKSICDSADDKYMAQQLLDLDVRGSDGETPLIKAAKTGRAIDVSLLISSGANIDLSDSQRGLTPLSWAAEMGHEAVVKLLLDTGQVDVNAKDITGRTPMDRAIKNKNLQIMYLLQRAGSAGINFNDEHLVKLLWEDAESGNDIRRFFDHINSFGSPVKFRSPRITVGASKWSIIFNPSEIRAFNVELAHTFVCESEATCVQFSRNGQRLAFGTSNSAQIYSLTTGERLCVFQDSSSHTGGGNFVHDICFSCDDQYLVIGSQDSFVRVWDISAIKVLHILRGHEKEVLGVDVSSDNTVIASCSGDETVRLWDMHSGECIQVIVYSDAVRSVSISPNCGYVAFAALDKCIRVYDRRGILHLSYANKSSHHQDYIRSIKWSPDGKNLVTASLDKTLKILDLSTLGRGPMSDRKIDKNIVILKGHHDFALSAVYTPDADWLISGSQDQTARCWNSHTGQPQFILKGHENAVTQVASSPHGNFFATCSMDRTVRVWSLQKIEPDQNSVVDTARDK